MQADKYIHWESLPLDDEGNRVAKMRNLEYEDALQKNLTAKFFQRLRIVSQSKLNFIMSGFGTTGSGKSYAMMFIIEKFLSYSNRTLPLEHCVYTLADLYDAIEKAEKGDVFLLDEQSRTSGTGSKLERDQLKNLESTIRQHKLSLFFLSPEYIKHTSHFILEIWEKGSLQPWNYSKPIDAQWKYTKSILYNHKEYMLGYIVTASPSNIEFLSQYEAKKSEYITAVRSNKTSGRSFYTEKLLKMLIKDDEFMLQMSKAETKTLQHALLLRRLEGRMLSSFEVKMLLEEIRQLYLNNE